jgi:hypothetical protein
MNKLVFALMAGCFSTVFAVNGAVAQSSVNMEKLKDQKIVAEIKTVTTSVKKQRDDLGTINPKALRNFAQTYKNVIDVRWEKIRNGFSARFNADGVSNLIYYSPHGKWAGILKGYKEDKMPPEVRKMVKREYYDYVITFVQEAETLDSGGLPTYFIILEDNDQIKQLKINDGQMWVNAEFKKS